MIAPSSSSVSPSLSGRTMSRRIAELPSLRYGPVGAKSSMSGPLRVSNHCQYDTFPKVSTSRKNNSRVYSDDSNCKLIKPVSSW